MWCNALLYSAVIGCCAAFTSASGPTDDRKSPEKEPGTLIQRLSHPQFEEREHAAQRLKEIGFAARAPLRAAIASSPDDTELVHRAGILLRHELPWAAPDDPPAVRALLEKEQALSPVGRAGIVWELNAVPDGAGGAVLLRLLLDDYPSTGWRVVTCLRQAHWRDYLKRHRADLASHTTNAPALALAGWAWREAVPEQAADLHRRAIERIASVAPLDEQIHALFESLVSHHARRQEFSTAADLLRWQYRLDPVVRDTPRGTISPLDDLFALHAHHGPLPNFGEDLIEHLPAVLTRPQIIYALARLLQRHKWPMAARLFRAGAMRMSGDSQVKHAHVAEYLFNNLWNEEAELELRQVVRLNDEPDNKHALNAHVRLGVLAAREGQHANAAREMRLTLRRCQQQGGKLWHRRRAGREFNGVEAEQQMWAEMHWHELMAAGKEAGAGSSAWHATRVLELAPEAYDLCADAILTLRTAGRAEEAAVLWHVVQQHALEWLAEAPENPSRLNQIAWLYARSGENPARALRLIETALAKEPDNASYLDTAAEAHFQMGNRAKAIELERRAIKLAPGTRQLLDQLKRFQTTTPE